MKSPRLAIVTRQWRMLVLLRRQPQTLQSLAAQLGVHWRTVLRDLAALEAVPLPIVRHQESAHDTAFWSLGSTPEWPRNEPAPIAEVRRAS